MMMSQVLLLIASGQLFDASLGMPAGKKIYNTTLHDPLVLFAVDQINQFSIKKKGGTSPIVAERIINATSQVVSGGKYTFWIEMCIEDLSLAPNIEDCTVGVWSRPWLQANESMLLIGEPKCYNLRLQK